MKKILISIGILTVLSVVAFLVYYPKAKTHADVVYSSLATYQDVVYKTVDGKPLTLDILMPTTEVYSEIPYVVYIHDGDFTDGDKGNLLTEINRQVVFDLLDKGYAIITVNFRTLNSAVHFPDNLVDIKDALRYLNKVAVTYNFDPNNVGIWGKGSGAYLALTIAYSANGSFAGETSLRTYNSNVNYAIDMSGLLTLSKPIEISTLTNPQIVETRDRLYILFGTTFDMTNLTTDDYATMARYNPTEYISYDTVPTLIIHGDSDTVYGISNATILKDKLDEYQIDYQMVTIPGGTHDLVDINDVLISNISTGLDTFVGNQYQAPSN